MLDLVLSQKVMTFAAEKHSGQERFPGMPYIVHPYAVSTGVIQHAKDFEGYLVEAYYASILHDVVEDCGVGYQEIVDLTGMRVVADAVMALTKDESVPKDYRIAESLERCKRVGCWVVGIKGLDRLNNMDPATVPSHWESHWCLDYAEQAVGISAQVKAAGMRGVARSLDSAIKLYVNCANRRI